MGGVTRRWCAIGVVIGIALITPQTSVQTQQAPQRATDLATLFAPGGILQDRNGDGVVDFVNARLVLGEKPDVGDVSAAADLAARLGFETMAMNLPLSAAPDTGTTAFIVGRDAALRTGATLPSELRPGDGMVVSTTAGGEPAVMVVGGDAAGTMAAAELLAGRLPHVWDPKAPTLGQVIREDHACESVHERRAARRRRQQPYSRSRRDT